MTLRGRLARYTEFFRKNGFAIGSALLAHRLISKFGGQSGLFWYKFYRQPLDSALAHPRSDSKLIFTWLDHYDKLLDALPRPLTNIESRFTQNVLCLAAIRNEQLAACAWFGFGEFDEDEVRCTYSLPSDAVWDFDIYVFPEYRFSRVFLKMWEEANKVLNSKGYTCSLSRISAYNKHSIRSHEKLGATTVGSAVFLRVRGVQLMLNSRKPFLSLSFTKKQAPRIDLVEV